MMAFFNLWSNWGATLYGEVRGASDFRQNIWAMAGALVATSIAAVDPLPAVLQDVRLGLLPRGQQRVLGRDDPDRRVAVPRPVGGVVPRQAGVLQFILIAILSLWFFGWVGTVFLSSTRVVFAAAFDRVLPEGVAKVDRNGVPVIALLLMLVPSLGIAALYAYSTNSRPTRSTRRS